LASDPDSSKPLFFKEKIIALKKEHFCFICNFKGDPRDSNTYTSIKEQTI